MVLGGKAPGPALAETPAQHPFPPRVLAVAAGALCQTDAPLEAAASVHAEVGTNQCLDSRQLMCRLAQLHSSSRISSQNNNAGNTNAACTLETGVSSSMRMDQ